MTNRARIIELGADGDGVAVIEGRRVFVPFTLPGEEAVLAVNGDRADAMSIADHSPDRIEPACGHFTACGGCALQHMAEPAYLAFKSGLVRDALSRVGLGHVPVNPILACAPGTRRRAGFSAKQADGKLVFGFRRAMSREIKPIRTCPVLEPAIAGRLDDLRAMADLATRLAGTTLLMSVTATETGLDIAFSKAKAPGDAGRRQMIALAIRLGFARVTFENELLVETRPPQVTFGSVAVSPPAGGFLQATRPAEAAMQALVAGHLGGAKKVADLFSGCGTFSLALAATASVHAVESDGRALAALDAARRHASGLKPVTTEKRDLFMRPLTAKELAAYDAVVIDPPRAGAEAQTKHLASARALPGSRLRRIAFVSCNPVTLARDLRTLADAGWPIRAVTPVDQFLWSPHVEAVAELG